MPKVFPSLLAADFSKLGEELKKIEGADALHLDIMDGQLVPNITFGFPVLESLRSHTKLPFDTHLMIQNPENFIERFAKAGSDMLSFHIEASSNPNELLERISGLGPSPGIAVDLGTPLEKAFPFLEQADFVMVMTVKAGFGGQSFSESRLAEIAILRKKIDEQGLKTEISVDGGINAGTGRKCVEAGANILIAGSSVFRAGNPEKAISDLRCAASK